MHCLHGHGKNYCVPIRKRQWHLDMVKDCHPEAGRFFALRIESEGFSHYFVGAQGMTEGKIRPRQTTVIRRERVAQAHQRFIAGQSFSELLLFRKQIP
jgi:hypothetical protein